LALNRHLTLGLYNIEINKRGIQLMRQRIVDIAGFKEDVGLDFETLKELYMIFADEIKKEKEAVNIHLRDEEVGELRKAVHNIKGIASSYRTLNVFESARNLDVKLKNQELENINTYVSELNEGIDEAVREIVCYFK